MQRLIPVTSSLILIYSFSYSSAFVVIVTLFYPFSREHIEIVALQNDLLFFKQRDGPYIPTLRLLHKCTLTSYCLSVCQFVCLSVCQFVCHSVCLSVCLSVSLSVCQFVYHSVCLLTLLTYSYIRPIKFTFHMSMSIYLFIHPFFYLSVH